MGMRQTMVAALALLALSWQPAMAGTAELRHGIARLLESLDAGLSRGDLHGLRIDIGTEIRLQGLAGTNSLAGLPEFGRRLAAADQAWTVLTAAASCQIENGAVRGAAECRSLITPMYRTLGIEPPDLAAPPNPGGLIQPLLQALQRHAETVIKAIR